MAKVVTLTDAQASTLSIYILITAKYRQDEIRASKTLELEKDPDGSPTFPNSSSNAEWWRNACRELEDIVLQVDNAPDLEVFKQQCAVANRHSRAPDR